MNQTPNKIWLTGIALEEHSVYQPRRQDKPTQSVYFLQKKTRLRTGQRLTQKDRDKDLVHKDKYMYKDKLTTTKTGI